MDNQEERNILPQDLRRVALLLGFSGGAVDVYSHLRFHTLVVTQTGNIVLMVAQIAEKQDNFLPRLTSIIVFSIGFVLGIAYKQRAQTPYWRIFAMMPMLIACLVLPFLPSDQLLFKIIALSFGTGLLMLTFTGSKIETVPYTIMMTSGNYRRMLVSWYHYATSAAKNPQDKRDVVNYTIIVLSFMLGALTAAVAYICLKDLTIWLVALALVLVMIFYAIEIARADHYVKEIKGR